MKITSNHLAQFMRAYAVIAFAACIPFLLQATDKANFISMLLVVILMVVVIVTMSYILVLDKRERLTTLESDCLNKLTVLYLELNKAENDLQSFAGISLDSGDENWVKDQNKYIAYLKQEIELVKTNL
jgi:hypothetical protein